MSPEATLLCLFIAFAVFVVAAIISYVTTAPGPGRWNLIAIGLAAWVLVPLWAAMKAL